MRRFGGDEQVALGAVFRRMAQSFSEIRIERNGVERHLYVGRGGKLGAHAPHALAGGTLALMGFALHDQNGAATSLRKMPRNTGTYNAAADDHHFRRLHSVGPRPMRTL